MCHCHHESCCSSKSACGCSSHSSHSCGCGSSCGSQATCGCTSCGSQCSCKSQSCGCGCKQCGGNYASKLLELADCAWMEVLKEKIKEHIQANAKNMDELARLISEANHEKWQKKMANYQCTESFEDKLGAFLGHVCSTHGKQGNQNQSQGNQKGTQH